MSRRADQLLVSGDDVIVCRCDILFDLRDDRRLFRNHSTDVAHDVIDLNDIFLLRRTSNERRRRFEEILPERDELPVRCEIDLRSRASAECCSFSFVV